VAVIVKFPLAGSEAVHPAVVTPAVVLTDMGWAGVQFSAVAEPPLGVYVKATVPVGFVAPDTAGVMVAVKVTIWLTAAEGSDDRTVVVVAVLPTVCTRGVEELPTKFESAEVNAATTLNEPLAGAEANV
jgi:hypothetical protein